MYWFSIFFFCITAAYGAPSSDARIWQDWQDLKNLYDSQNYEAALKELQAHPQENSHFYYNLGTIHYRLGHPGTAVAYLEKANRLAPYDPDIQYNLTLAKSVLSDSIGLSQLDPASTWTEQLADRVSLDEVRATLGLLGLIVVLLWTRAYLKTRNLKKVFIQPAGFLGLLGFGLTVGVYGVQRLGSSCPPAICLEKQSIRSGPGQQFMELAQTIPGAKLRLLGASAPAAQPTSTPSALVTGDPTQPSSPSSEIWQQVRYSPDGIGWIKSSSLLML
jgi:hypothetical protein